MVYIITARLYGTDCMLDMIHMEVSKYTTVEKMIEFWANRGYKVRYTYCPTL